MTKILIIEDETPLRESIVDTLEFEGFEVVEAANGLQGWEKACAEHPDIIICDVSMPKLNGYELLHRLREEPETAGVPFIFLTARADRAYMRHGMELGADDYVTKPFTQADLLGAIRVRLARLQKLQKPDTESLNELKSQLVHRISHELRAPLTSITTVQDIVEKQLGSLELNELQELLNIQRTGSQRLHHLVEQTVLITEIKTGALSAQQVRQHGALMPIWDVLAAAVNLARKFSYNNQDMPIYLDDHAGDARLRCVSGALRHALAELIANAVTYSDADGQVEVTEWVDNGHICIRISDQGSGMPETAISDALREFEQVDRDQQEQQGMGLGLPLAQQVIELHGGTLAVQSQPGRGTEVLVQLPTEL
jgi:two-component system, sensor histidine kinase and response regulator